MKDDIELRPACAADFAMAIDLYLTTMQPYTAALMVWDEAKQRESFASQWSLQATKIIVHQGRDVGWLDVGTSDVETLLRQFFISPECQGKGIGSQVLRQLIEGWSETDAPVSLTVLKNNPARRLYERFGFTVVGEVGVKFQMTLRKH